MASGSGWFVVSARDARWWAREGRQSVSFTDKTAAQDVADANVPWLPSEPAGYHDGWFPLG